MILIYNQVYANNIAQKANNNEVRKKGTGLTQAAIDQIRATQIDKLTPIANVYQKFIRNDEINNFAAAINGLQGPILLNALTAFDCLYLVLKAERVMSNANIWGNKVRVFDAKVNNSKSNKFWIVLDVDGISQELQNEIMTPHSAPHISLAQFEVAEPNLSKRQDLIATLETQFSAINSDLDPGIKLNFNLVVFDDGENKNYPFIRYEDRTLSIDEFTSTIQFSR